MENVKTKSAMVINRTCGTAVGGMLFMSMLVLGNNISTVSANCLCCIDEEAILSDNEKKCVSGDGINYFLSGYNVSESRYSGLETVVINEEKMYNLRKIEQIATLEDGWNGNKAKAFKSQLIEVVRSVITALEIQPEVFPTACDSIQLEYEKEDGSYLEIELNLDNTWEVFEVNSNGEEIYTSISAEVEKVNEVVNRFYG